MKILVVSDTHGRNGNLKLALAKEKPDKVFHLGDSQQDMFEMQQLCGLPVEMVRGNCDSMFCNCPSDLVLNVGNRTVFLTHGHRYGVRSGLEQIREAAKSMGCDTVLYGHTHVPDINYDYGMIVANPGSLTEPRGIGHLYTYMIIEVDEASNATFTMKQID